MCSQFGIKTDAKTLSQKYSIKIPKELQDQSWDQVVQGFLKTQATPVVILDNDWPTLKIMQWSLCPTWAKTFPFDASTYNARLSRTNAKTKVLEHIWEVPSFKHAINNQQTCLVPMNHIVESSYFGQHQGHVVKLYLKNAELFFAAGIHERHELKGQVHDTFAILTDGPDDSMLFWGHDRKIMLLSPESLMPWQKQATSAKESVAWLRAHQKKVSFEGERLRPLKEGWQRRSLSEEEVKKLYDQNVKT